MKKLSALFLLLTTIVCFTSAQSVTSPTISAQSISKDSPATQQMQAWLAAFNSGDRTILQNYLQQNRPNSLSHLDDELQFRQQTGGFDLKKIESSTPTSAKAIVKERDSDQFARLEIEVEPEAPHRIAKLGLQTIPHPLNLPFLA